LVSVEINQPYIKKRQFQKLPQFHQAKICGHNFLRTQEKDNNVGESEKYLHNEDMEDHDIQTKENEEDEEEPIGINDLMKSSYRVK